MPGSVKNAANCEKKAKIRHAGAAMSVLEVHNVSIRYMPEQVLWPI